MTPNEILAILKAKKSNVLFIDFDSRSAILATDEAHRDDRGILAGDVRDVPFNAAVIARTDPSLDVIWSKPATGNRLDGRANVQECVALG